MASKADVDAWLLVNIRDQQGRDTTEKNVRDAMLQLADLDSVQLPSATRLVISNYLDGKLADNFSAGIGVANQREAYTYVANTVASDLQSRGAATATLANLLDEITAYGTTGSQRPNPDDAQVLFLSMAADFDAWGQTLPAVQAPLPTAQAITDTKRMLQASEFDLTQYTTNATSFGLVSHTGAGRASVKNGSTLCYESSWETSDTVTVTYSATNGTGSVNNTLTITITDRFTLAELKAEQTPMFATLIATPTSWLNNQDSVYDNASVPIYLRNMFQATGDTDYLDWFKTFATNYEASATVNLVTDVNGPSSNWGASGTYSGWGEVNPNTKALDQLMMGTYLFLYDILAQKGQCASLPASDRTWAQARFDWMTRNVMELCRTLGGNGSNAKLSVVAYKAHTHTLHQATVPFAWGYWSSDLGVAMCSVTLDLAIRDVLSYSEPAYWALIAQKSIDDDWITVNGTEHVAPSQWRAWWAQAVSIDANGRGIWDAFEDVGGYLGNDNISASHGWGFPGERKVPTTQHALRRYGYLAWLGQYLELPELNNIFEAIERQWADIIVLGDDYVTGDGTHAGETAGTIQVANYIDGDNGRFRYGAGYLTPNNSNEGMNSQSYYIQTGFRYLPARNALIDLHHLANTDPAPVSTTKEYTGTYQRHAINAGKVGCIANALAAYAQPL